MSENKVPSAGNHFSSLAESTTFLSEANQEQKAMLRKETLKEFTPQERAQFSSPGMRAILALKMHWRITDSNISRLLGRPSRTELKEWMRAAETNERIILSSDQLHRISAVLKVFDALTRRYEGAQEKSSRWLRTPHKAVVFSGKTPLSYLEHADLDCVLAVRNYVSTWKDVKEVAKIKKSAKN